MVLSNKLMLQSIAIPRYLLCVSVEWFRVVVHGWHDAQNRSYGRIFFDKHFVVWFWEFGRIIVDIDHMHIHSRSRRKNRIIFDKSESLKNLYL